MTVKRPPILSLALGLSLGIGNAQEVAETTLLESQFRDNVQPVLKNFCYRCHGPEKQKSGVRVDILDGRLEDKQLFLLKHVLHQLEDQAMPPEDERQPSAAERESVVQWAARALQAGEAKVRAKNGTVRRLTVAQYHNTLRDLLGIEDRLADALPADGVSAEGFRNNGQTLLITPLMMETYFEIAEKALALCLVDEKTKPRIQSFRVELGAGINQEPYPGRLVLNGGSLLSTNDFIVRQIVPRKPFSFEPHMMRTKFRFIEGYNGNATVRGWRDFEGIYHSVFAAMIGKHFGTTYGQTSQTVPEGLLLQPRAPETENGTPPAWGPAPTFSLPLRELPRAGMFQVTVEAARYQDGLLPGVEAAAAAEFDGRVSVEVSGGGKGTLEIPAAGVYQVDVVLAAGSGDDMMTVEIGARTFSKRLPGPFASSPEKDLNFPFLVVRLPAGRHEVVARNGDNKRLRHLHFTPVLQGCEAARQFEQFEKRVPELSVHLGVRRDCGVTLTRVGQPQPVPAGSLERYTFRAPMSGFPSPELEEGNANYLAGLRELAIRSERTDDRQTPRLLVHAVEFEGPFYESWPPEGHRAIFFPSAHQGDSETYAREVIARFATRAFRRPVREEELESFLAVWREAYTGRRQFQESVVEALQAILTSPQFLFVIEESAGPQAEPLAPHELASKLSYFLWNTAPDEKLLALAAQGTLREVLSPELDRMVADVRFRQFADEFVSQWLSLDKFEVVDISRGQFPRLNPEVKRELRNEPVHFVTHLIRENLPLRNLIQSDFVVTNKVVASYYGIGSRIEQGLAFVPVKHESENLGGVLSQAAILAGLSDGRESNPVKRGAWLARKIIAEPPEPPPPNVPELPEEGKGTKTLRERLEEHRNQDGCAECHEKIDPWGLPLEQFDAGGLFKSIQVDASSTLPDGTEVSGTSALKNYLADERIEQVAYSFLKHLASYATGRSLTFNECEYLKREGRKELEADGYRMKDCVRFVIESPIFLEK